MKLRSSRLWLGLALGHLLLVTLGAFEIETFHWGPLGRAISFYGELSGSGDAYGFFAPGVFGQLRARFEYVDADGKTQFATLESHVSHEADLRVGNIIDQFQVEDREDDRDDDNDPKVNAEAIPRSIAASLAGTVFGRHPGARSVTVLLDKFIPVSMDEYRGGKRAVWEPLYEAKFAYSPREKANDAP